MLLGTDYSIPVGFRKILQRKVVENVCSKKKKRPRTGISRGNACDEICAFKFAPSRHAIDLHTFLHLTQVLCRSLVVEGSVVRSWFLSHCSTPVPHAAPGITRSSSKRNCRATLSQKTRNLPTCNGQPVHVHAWTQPRETLELQPDLLCPRPSHAGRLGRLGPPHFFSFFFFFFFFCRFSQAKKKNKNWRDDTLITQRVSLNKGSMIAFIAIVLCRSAAAMPWLG